MICLNRDKDTKIFANMFRFAENLYLNLYKCFIYLLTLKVFYFVIFILPRPDERMFAVAHDSCVLEVYT